MVRLSGLATLFWNTVVSTSLAFVFKVRSAFRTGPVALRCAEGLIKVPSGRRTLLGVLRQSLAGILLVAVCLLDLQAQVVDEPPATGSTAASASENNISPADLQFFEQHIRPLFSSRCYECHSREADVAEGDLVLDSRQGWLHGGSRGPAIQPGDPENSLLMQTLSYEDPELQMPPDQKLAKRYRDLLAEWIRRGAPDPRMTGSTKNEREDKAFDLSQRLQQHWAWQPVQRPNPPHVEDPAWPTDDLDRFVLHRLEKAGLRPAPEASRTTWLRRATFDLTGLPPTRDQVEQFLNDESPNAYGRVVDELLSRREFGECWAQHWLDLVRFAETKGHEGDYEIPYAWRYRDYVIRALNQNVAYDQFVTEHLAGDLIDSPRLDPKTKTRTNQSIQGTGFWYLGEATHSPVDIRGEEADRVANQIDVFGKTFLGLTIACARCHDHKFDAISMSDYYALCGVLQSSSYQHANVADPGAITNAQEQLKTLNRTYRTKIWHSYRNYLRQQLADFDHLLLKAVTPARMLLEQPSFESADRTIAENHDEQSFENQLAHQLVDALNDPFHPLYAFATLALGSAEGQPAAKKERIMRLQRRWAEHQQRFASQLKNQAVVATRRDGELTRLPERVPFDPQRHTVVNFSCSSHLPDKLERENWLVSGAGFGDGPVAAGTPILCRKERSPVELLAPERAATNRHLSSRLTGLYRTPTFEVVGDRLWYRFRGKAKVFLAVDSHRTVAGPLHAVVRQTLASPHNDAWFGHRVDDYLGHRVHVEFKPDGDFMLYEVRFGEHQPPDRQRAAEVELTDRLLHESDSLEQLAQQTTSILRELLNQDSVSRPTIDWINWLIQHGQRVASDHPVDEQPAYESLAMQYWQQRDQIEAMIPEPVWAVAMLDGSGENEHVHLRGSHRRLAEEATPRGTLQAMGGAFQTSHGSGRLELAQTTVDPDNPLTARVQVNRIWHHLLGRGIVASTDNFGQLGKAPTHPELLDYLASEFVEGGWNMKNLIRRIVLSRTYRMQTEALARATKVDPENDLLHSARIKRLTGEKIRDAILACSGQLNRQPFGPSVRIHITDFMRHNRSPNWSGPVDGQGRRSIYLEVRRNALSHFLTAFDKPVPFTTVGRRNVSNSPAQPLILLNDPLVHDQANQWAKQLVKKFDRDREAIHDVYWTAFCRPPSAAEKKSILAYLAGKKQDRSGDGANRVQAWTSVCLTIYNMKEFIFLP